MKKWTFSVGTFMLMMALLTLSVIVISGCEKEPPPPPPECADDLDCPAGKACQGGKCVQKVTAPPPECTGNADCADNKICVAGKCKYECQGEADCGSGMQCKDNRCVRIECSLEIVHFPFDEYYLTSEAQSKLRQNAECIKAHGYQKMVVEGHCDERGTAEYNLSLGQKRAESVKDYLIDMGVNGPAMRTISYGEEQPLVNGHNEDAWAKNRRAVIEPK